MTCTTLSDRIPLVALGRETWSAEELTHLSGCVDCANEWRLVQQAARVGEGFSASLNAAQTSSRVLHRLATEPVLPARSRAWWYGGAGIAAAGLLLLLFRPGEPGTPLPPASAFEIPLVELDSLSHDQLRLVLESIEEPLETPTVNETPTMLDLDDTQLERVLRSLEG